MKPKKYGFKNRYTPFSLVSYCSRNQKLQNQMFFKTKTETETEKMYQVSAFLVLLSEKSKEIKLKTYSNRKTSISNTGTNRFLYKCSRNQKLQKLMFLKTNTETETEKNWFQVSAFWVLTFRKISYTHTSAVFYNFFRI